MKNVLLVSPSSDTYYTLTAHLGLSYIATKLSEDFNVYGLDLNVYRQLYQAETKSLLKLVETILGAYSIEYVGISVLEETLKEANEIAKICKKNSICCIAGGIYPTLFPDNMSEDYQYCIRGDGEFVMRELLLALENNADVKGINGLSIYSKEKRKWFHSGTVAAITCKDDFLPNRDVFSRLNGEFRYTSARIITSRGCVYHCSFCTNRIFQSKYIRRSTDSIVKEVESLVASGIKEIILSDDQFLGTSLKEYQQALDILNAVKKMLIENGIRINFQVRADHWLKCREILPEFEKVLCDISYGFIDDNAELHKFVNGHAMHGVGIDIGVESFLDRKLLFFRKGYTSDCNINCIKSLIELPVDLGIYMILFTPDIKMEEIIEEITIYYDEYLVKNYKSKILLANIFKALVPYEGTNLYDELLQTGELVLSRGYHFKDLRVAAFYVIINFEVEKMIYRADVTFDDLYEAVLGLANYCCKLKPIGSLANVLHNVVANQENDIREIYSMLPTLC